LIIIEKGKHGKINKVFLNPETEKYYLSDNVYQRIVQASYLPMVVQPLDWTPKRRGGHFYNEGVLPIDSKVIENSFFIRLDKSKRGAEGRIYFRKRLIGSCQFLAKSKMENKQKIFRICKVYIIEEGQIVTDLVVTNYEIKTLKEKIRGKNEIEERLTYFYTAEQLRKKLVQIHFKPIAFGGYTW
jgi:hypothetical protein